MVAAASTTPARAVSATAAVPAARLSRTRAADAVPDRQWHVTYVQGWDPTSLPREEIVHVGTHEAASDRLRGARHALENAEYPQAILDRVDLTAPHLHEVELFGTLYPGVLPDEDHALPAVMAAHPECDVFAYTNDHEAPGSVSYAARPHAVRVISSQPVAAPA